MEENQPMSFSDIIRVPFGYLLEFLYNVTNNYGIALILFALVVKLILLPMGMKSKKSTMKMSRVSPYLKELEKKYGNDQQKYQQEVMKFYKEEGISPKEYVDKVAGQIKEICVKEGQQVKAGEMVAKLKEK